MLISLAFCIPNQKHLISNRIIDNEIYIHSVSHKYFSHLTLTSKLNLCFYVSIEWAGRCLECLPWRSWTVGAEIWNWIWKLSSQITFHPDNYQPWLVYWHPRYLLQLQVTNLPFYMHIVEGILYIHIDRNCTIVYSTAFTKSHFVSASMFSHDFYCDIEMPSPADAEYICHHFLSRGPHQCPRTRHDGYMHERLRAKSRVLTL